MNCAVCGKASGKRIISGIPMCEQCFSQIVDLRNGKKSAISFYSNRNNLAHASKEADAYIGAILKEKYQLEEQRQLEVEEEKKLAQIEHEKQEYARSIIGLYEYDVVTILNKGHGQVDREQMLQILSSRARDGWKLHTIYSNELGKNAIALLGFALNETACEDVLIFERKLRDQDA